MTIDGADYWFDSDGTMATGWRHYSNDAWYYFKSGGAIASSTWVESDGQWFYLGADGAMMKNTVTPDGYTLDASRMGEVEDNPPYRTIRTEVII